LWPDTLSGSLGEEGYEPMTATLDDVAKKKPAEVTAEQQAATELVRMAKEQGLSLTGPDGLLKQLTKSVIETALDEEMTEHLGYAKHDRAGIGAENIRNGTRPKTVLPANTGPVEIDVPRDRAGTFEPQIVKKRQRRLGEVDEIVLSLYAKGLTTGEISAHFAEIYGASVSKETISRITDRVIEEMQSWQARPLDEVYAAIFIDAVVVKIRDGQVANRPIYAAIGVSLAGDKEILGLWAGTGGEGAKFWMAVLTDLKNRGVRDTFFVVCDGLKGLPEVVTNVWPQATVQTSLVHSGGARSGSGCHPHRRERASADRPSRSRCRPVPLVGDGPRTANWSCALSAITSDGGGLSARVSQPRRGSSCQNCSPASIGVAPIIK
jgi:putative transposase